MTKVTKEDVGQWFSDIDRVLERHGFTHGGTLRKELPTMHASAAQAPALQARVLELTAERDVLESERDALRAQVEMVRPLVASATRHDMKPSLRSKILDTLSAPPAEATPAPERDPRFQCSVHPDCFGDSEYCTKRK